MDERIVQQRDRIYEVARQYHVHNIRIFGSQARNEERANSDVDFLVEFEQPNLLDRIAFKHELERLLGMSVDVLTDETVHPVLRDNIHAEARPL
ncbi:nucleotidyltransferase family protein [Alicyclobacillus cellulosilyticus]|nr:nucleotidyltransferase family protein [Alicyclobacillus cellulosilyticus]